MVDALLIKPFEVGVREWFGECRPIKVILVNVEWICCIKFGFCIFHKVLIDEGESASNAALKQRIHFDIVKEMNFLPGHFEGGLKCHMGQTDKMCGVKLIFIETLLAKGFKDIGEKMDVEFEVDHQVIIKRPGTPKLVPQPKDFVRMALS